MDAMLRCAARAEDHRLRREVGLSIGRMMSAYEEDDDVKRLIAGALGCTDWTVGKEDDEEDGDDIGDEMDIDWVFSPDSDDEHCNIQNAGGFNGDGDGDSNNNNGDTQGLLTRYKPTPPGATA